MDDYKQAKNRLLLLGYDGTLVPFAEKPDQAKPDIGLVRVLKMLSGYPGIIEERIPNWK